MLQASRQTSLQKIAVKLAASFAAKPVTFLQQNYGSTCICVFYFGTNFYYKSVTGFFIKDILSFTATNTAKEKAQAPVDVFSLNWYIRSKGTYW